MLLRPWTAACLLLILPAAACGGAEAGAPEWSYEGTTGPAHWGDLKPEYALAKTGKRQSPIDIVKASTTKQDVDPIEVNYEKTAIEILNNGHTIEENYHGNGSLRVGGQEYELAQFHFHLPSEHTVDGKHSAMEMHLVHKDAGGKLAVIGVLIEEGKKNPVLESLIPYVPKESGKTLSAEGGMVNAADLLPASLASYRYSGSLTTPPCSEDVSWFVLQNPIEFSKQQIDTFRAIIEGNNRPTQPLNGRAVTAADQS